MKKNDSEKKKNGNEICFKVKPQQMCNVYIFSTKCILLQTFFFFYSLMRDVDITKILVTMYFPIQKSLAFNMEKNNSNKALRAEKNKMKNQGERKNTTKTFNGIYYYNIYKILCRMD